MKSVISIRLALILSSLFLVIMAVCLTLFLIAKSTENVRNQYLRSLETRTKLFSDGIRESLLSGDYPTVIQKSYLLNEQEDILAVQVKLADGSEIASFAKEGTPLHAARFSTYDTIFLENHDNDENKNIYGNLFIEYDLSRLNVAESKILTEVLVAGGGILGLIALSLWLVSRYILTPISQLQKTAKIGDLSGFTGLESNSRLKEINDLQDSLSGMAEKLLEAEKRNKEFAVISAIAETSRQVAHDIRSPLSALNMISSQLKDLPEDQRLIVRKATQRINDIANQLLAKSRKVHTTDSSDVSGPIMLAALVESIVSEKRSQFKDRMNLEIQADLSSGYGLFSSISGTELARVISNLVNNSVEAIPGAGVIEVKLSSEGDKSVISVHDNGKGIPAHILARLGESGFSHGKEGTQSGSGLGIYHAKKTVKKAGGELIIESAVNRGTTVHIRLPRSPAPSWFVEKLSLNGYSKVVSVDDDPTIHRIWEKRFKSLNSHPTHISIFAIKELEDLIKQDSASDSLYLIDYELLGQEETGIDIIERLKITDQAILVTSHFDEEAVLKRVLANRIKLIPKNLIPFVPLSI